MQDQRTASPFHGHLSTTSNDELAAMLTAAGATPMLAPVIDARAEHMHQQRKLAAIVPTVRALATTATPEQRPHVHNLISTIRSLAASVKRADASTVALAGLVDPITSVHEFARTVRPLLATLGVANLSTEVEAATIGELHRVFERTAPRTRGAFSLRQLLGVTRYTVLVDRLADWTELRQVEGNA